MSPHTSLAASSTYQRPGMVVKEIDNLKYDDAFQDEDNNTFVLTFTGIKAYRASHATVGTILTLQVGYTAGEITEIYRYEEPGVWYFRLTPEATARINPHQTDVTFDGYMGTIANINKRQQITIIHWAPARAGEAFIKKALATVVTGPFTLKRHPMHADRWRICHGANQEIPHYLGLNFVKSNGEKHRHIVMLTQAGRQPVCRHCGSADHYTNTCTTRKQVPTKARQPAPTIALPAQNPPKQSPPGTNSWVTVNKKHRHPKTHSAPNSPTFQPKPSTPPQPKSPLAGTKKRTRRPTTGSPDSDDVPPTRRRLFSQTTPEKRSNRPSPSPSTPPPGQPSYAQALQLPPPLVIDLDTQDPPNEENEM